MLIKHTEYNVNVIIEYKCLFLRGFGFINPVHLGFFLLGRAKTLDGSGQPGPFFSYGRSAPGVAPEVPSASHASGNAQIYSDTTAYTKRLHAVSVFLIYT
jgi:hypothetical protein